MVGCGGTWRDVAGRGGTWPEVAGHGGIFLREIFFLGKNIEKLRPVAKISNFPPKNNLAGCWRFLGAPRNALLVQE